MKAVEIIPLALKKIELRGVDQALVIETVNEPDQIVDGYGGRKVRQKIYAWDGEDKLLRVVVNEETDKFVVITAYLTSRIKRYWR